MPTIYDLRQIEAWRREVLAEIAAYDNDRWGMF